jgi:hypothetical protein
MFFGNNGFGCNKGCNMGHRDGGCDCCTLLILILLLCNCGGKGFQGDDDGCGCIWYIILIFLLMGCVCK